jgi:4'-phosphopantetheinyl transferase
MLPIGNLSWDLPPITPDLKKDQLHVWRVRLDGVENQDDALWKLLSPAEQERAERFHFDQHRFRFLRSHGTLRLILSRYTGIAPEQLCMQSTPLGKPYLSGVEGLDLRFNLSHSGYWMLVGVGMGRELGVDVELLYEKIDWQMIAAGYFSAQEKIAILGLAREQDQLEAFFRVWTIKEAYLKAIGKGLSGGLEQAVVQVQPGMPGKFLALPAGENELRRWQVYSLQPASGAVGAAVVERGEGNLQLIQYHWKGLDPVIT